MFISKFIKLLGHYIRYPVDILLLPVSILFGYFHGGIKMYAVLTLNVVSLLFPKVCSIALCMERIRACCVQEIQMRHNFFAVPFFHFFFFIFAFFPLSFSFSFLSFIDITALS
jgi:hypothetical protein